LPIGHFPSESSPIVIGDRAFGFIEDDFSPISGTSITDVIWWGSYVQELEGGQAGCVQIPNDNFQLRIYDSFTGYFGNELLSQFVSPTRCATNSSAGGRTIYRYSVTLPTAVTVTPGSCYWLEISNETGANSPECTWLWNTASTANAYSLQGSIGSAASTNDMAFQLNLPIAASDCGTPLGACCTCSNNSCSAQQELTDCSPARWVPQNCAVNLCSAAANESCAAAAPIINVNMSFRNTCAGNDIPAMVPTDEGIASIGADLWYTFTTTAAMPSVTFDNCDTSFDTLMPMTKAALALPAGAAARSPPRLLRILVTWFEFRGFRD
jgi:hypothetical protein